MSQKRTLEDWEKAECAALKGLVEAYNRERPKHERITQEAAGAALGITQGAFSNYLNARIALNKEIAASISRLFGIPVERFSRRLAAEIADMAQVVAPSASTGPETPKEAEHKETNVHAVDFRQPRLRDFEIDIPQYDVRAAMGAGQVPPEYVELVRHVVVDKRHLDLFGVSYSASGNLAMITGWGQSMADTIHHGEPVIVDRGVDRFIGDGVYVFTWDDLIYLKRLQKEPPARLKVISDNRNHDPFYIPVSEVIIHARVVMVWNARKV